MLFVVVVVVEQPVVSQQIAFVLFESFLFIYLFLLFLLCFDGISTFESYSKAKVILVEL